MTALILYGRKRKVLPRLSLKVKSDNYNLGNLEPLRILTISGLFDRFVPFC